MSRQGVSPPLWQSRPPLGAPPMRPSGASVPLVPHLAILSQPSSARTQYQASPAMQFSASLQTILIGQLTMHYIVKHQYIKQSVQWSHRQRGQHFHLCDKSVDFSQQEQEKHRIGTAKRPGLFCLLLAILIIDCDIV